MTFLFRRKLALSDKLLTVVKLTTTHAQNLGLYVMLYKFIKAALRRTTPLSEGLRAAVAGFLGGGVMFGDVGSVNTQINLYVFSRVAMAIGHAARAKSIIPEFSQYYRLWAAVTWALVMLLFVEQRKHMQKSLVNAMTYLYDHSNDPNSWWAKL